MSPTPYQAPEVTEDEGRAFLPEGAARLPRHANNSSCGQRSGGANNPVRVA